MKIRIIQNVQLMGNSYSKRAERNEKRVKSDMRTLIAIPCMDMIHTGFAQSLINLRKGEGVDVIFRPGSLIYDARNIISLVAIERNYDRVMWLDSDMMFTPDAFEMLRKDMDERGCDMVTALYFTRDRNVKPVIYSQLEEPVNIGGKAEKRITHYTDYPRDTVFQAQGCGFGCVMTSVKLLRDVWDRFGPAFAPMPWAGEDLSFCWRVRQLGYEILCDSRVVCGHIGNYVYTEDNYDAIRAGKKVTGNG